MVGDGSLIIEVETKGEWSYRRQEKLQLFKRELNMSAAENFCKGQGGQLASVESAQQNEELKRIREENEIWLGGRKKT